MVTTTKIESIIIKFCLYPSNVYHSVQGGFLAVDIAVQQGHVDVVKMLLDKEAKNGMKAVHQAAKKDNKEALKLLLNQDKQLVNARAPVSLAYVRFILYLQNVYFYKVDRYHRNSLIHQRRI